MLKASFFLNLSVARRIFIIFGCFDCVFRRTFFVAGRFGDVYRLRRHVTITHLFEVFRVYSVDFRLISLHFSEFGGLDDQMPQDEKYDKRAENRRVNDKFRGAVRRFGAS